MQRFFTLSYEIDLYAENVEEAVKEATACARDNKAIASWCVTSASDANGDPLPEISGVASLLPDGTVELDLNG